MSTTDTSTSTSMFSELSGEPVMLTVNEDATITITRRGELERVTVAELNSRYPDVPAVDLADDVVDELRAEYEAADLGDDLYRAWQRFRGEAGGEQSAVAVADFAGDGDDEDVVFASWRRYRQDQGMDLSDDGEGEAGVDLTLKIGQPVQWGSGEGKGHGLVMEVDTAEGNVVVHTCEVIDDFGSEPALSPTGRTIKINGSKLRPVDMPIVGERPDDLSGSSRHRESEEDALYADLERDLRLIRGESDE